MSVTINKTTIINSGGGYGSFCGFGGCRRFTPYYSSLFSGGWGGYCCNPIAPLAVVGGVVIGMNFPAICKGIGKGISNFFGWIGRGFKKKPKAAEEQKQTTDKTEPAAGEKKKEETDKTQEA